MCRICGQDKEVNANDECVECMKVERNRVASFKRLNAGWVEVAKEADIPLWERQPVETDREWQIWLAYRDCYPSKRASYREVAMEHNIPYGTVKQAASKWDFPMRMQAWAKRCDELTMAQRQKEILEMNKKHVDMATDLNNKIAIAIGNIDPEALTPREIKELLKLSSELERKARLDTPVIYKPDYDENKELRHAPTNSGDLKEVLSILSKAGVLDAKNIGLKQTTEIVVKE